MGESLLKLPGPFAPSAEACDGEVFPSCGSILPEPHTDFIFAVIVAELGAFGACGLIAIYALIGVRGFKTAVMAPDGFSKLLATGLTAVFCLQAFVIIGGVVKLIPLTGVTLPFISAGGSSVVANMILLALLLLISEKARGAPGTGRGAAAVNAPDRPPLRRDPPALHRARRLHVALVRARGRRARVEAREPPPPDPGAADRARVDHLVGRRSHRRVATRRAAPENPNQRVFVRNYPQGSLFGNPVGYSFVEVERTGIELSENDLLSGDQNEFATLIDQLSGSTREGADITLTLDAEAQRVATDALQSAIDATPGRDGGGSVVAIEPDTGAVRVMASVPGYRPEHGAGTTETFSQLSESEDVGHCVNRPTQDPFYARLDDEGRHRRRRARLGRVRDFDDV